MPPFVGMTPSLNLITLLLPDNIKQEKILRSPPDGTINEKEMRSIPYPFTKYLQQKRGKHLLSIVNLDINYNFVLLKRIFYIFLFIAGSHLSANAQIKTAFNKGVNGADEAVKTVKLYPNPATSFINFEFDKKYDATYTLLIFNFIGKKIEDLKITDKKITLPLNDYYRGIYVFQVRDKQGEVMESGKFQVSR